MSQLNDTRQAAGGQQRATGQRQDLKVAHRAQVLETKVADLRTPSQKEGVQGNHRGNVADTDISNVDTPKSLSG